MLIPSRGGISKLFWSICTPLIDNSNPTRSAVDSGYACGNPNINHD
jgi:hypothetical protein